MELKRIYDTPEGWEKKVDARGDCINPPPIKYVALIHTGTGREQNFSQRFLLDNAKRVRIEGDKLTFDVSPEPLVYTIKRVPGRYCLHCGAKLIDDEKGEFARAHVAMEHAGKASPDSNVPAGYVRVNAFECVLDSAQHEKFRRQPGKRHRPHLRREA